MVSPVTGEHAPEASGAEGSSRGAAHGVDVWEGEAGTADGFPASWAHSGALRDVARAQRALGRHLESAGARVGFTPPAARWLVHGPILGTADAGFVGGVLEDLLALVDAGTAPGDVLGLLDELMTLTLLHRPLAVAADRSLVELCELVAAHEAACGRREWCWVVARHEGRLTV